MIAPRTKTPLSPEIILMSAFALKKLAVPISRPAMQLLVSRAGAVDSQMNATTNADEIVLWMDERARKTKAMEGLGL